MTVDADALRAALEKFSADDAPVLSGIELAGLRGCVVMLLARLDTAERERDEAVRLDYWAEEIDARLRELAWPPHALTRDCGSGRGPEELAAEVVRLRTALRGCVQFGVGEDDEVWIAANPSGVSLAAEVLGLNAETIRDGAGLGGDTDTRERPGLGGGAAARNKDET